MQVARDCAETGVELSLWSIPPQGAATFDAERFYVETLLTEKEYKAWRAAKNAEAATSDGFIGDDGEEIMSLCDRIQTCGCNGFSAKDYKMRRREHRKRRLGTLTLNLHRPGEAGAAIAMG